MTYISTIKKRIIEHLDNQSITKRSFYLKTGIANGTLDKNTGVSEMVIEKYISCYPEINPTWLLTGEGAMFTKNNSLDTSSEPTVSYEKKFKLMTDTDIDDQTIPLYNLEATAGIVELFKDSSHAEVIDTMKIPNLPKCDGALFVTGDSMYPILKSGDIIVYKQVNDFQYGIFFGEMYLVSIEVDGEDYTSVKYIQKSEKGDEFIRLVSHNQHHQPRDFPLHKVRALALVKASVRMNAMS